MARGVSLLLTNQRNRPRWSLALQPGGFAECPDSSAQNDNRRRLKECMANEVEETLSNEASSSPGSPDASANAREASSDLTQPDAKNGAKSSTAQGGSKAKGAGGQKPSSIAEALDGAVLEEPAEEQQQREELGQEESPTTKESEEADKGPDGESKPGEAKDERNAEQEKSSDVHFHKRPEWTELKKALGDDGFAKARPILRKVLESEHRLTERVKTLQPMAEVVSELRSHTGDEQGFKTMRQIVRAYATDPLAAVPILQNMLQDARTRAGLPISSPDLQTREQKIAQDLKEGLIDEAEAESRRKDLTEVETARATRRAAEGKVKQTQEEVLAERQQAQNQATLQSLNSWEQNIRSRYPDFGEVTEVTNPGTGSEYSVPM